MASEHPANHVSIKFVEKLIRGICHDFGAPVRHATQFSQMLNQSDLQKGMEDKHLRWLSMIEESGVQMQAMLTSLSLLSRLTMQTDQTTRLDLRVIFDRLLSFHQRACSNHVKHEVDITINEDWPSIIGCEHHWTTLFSCLIENALMYQPKDPEHAIKLKVCCGHVNSKLTFTLEDNGIGASEHQRNEMARPFKRLNRPEDYPGIGMGLAYCECIAELNNAQLNFNESQLGGLCVTYTQSITQAVGGNIRCVNEG